MEIVVELDSAEDILGYELDSTYSWTFYIDTEPPVITLLEAEILLHLIEPVISWNIIDYGAGVDELSIAIFADSDELHVGDAGVTFDGVTLTFDAAGAGYDLESEDLLTCIEACDLAQFCGANCADTTCIIISLAKDTPCEIWPIPFTPNDDGANDVVWFEYPNMQFEGAFVELFDLEGRRVFSENFPPGLPESVISWDGFRNNSKKAVPGTYLYVITRGGQVLCKGTLVLVR